MAPLLQPVLPARRTGHGAGIVALLFLFPAAAILLLTIPAPAFASLPALATVYCFCIASHSLLLAVPAESLLICCLAALPASMPGFFCAAWLDGEHRSRAIIYLLQTAAPVFLAAGCHRIAEGGARGAIFTIIFAGPPVAACTLYISNPGKPLPAPVEWIQTLSPLASAAHPSLQSIAAQMSLAFALFAASRFLDRKAEMK